MCMAFRLRSMIESVSLGDMQKEIVWDIICLYREKYA